jgi:hypothetical protein
MSEHESGAPDASEALLGLLFLALDHGIGSITRGGPLIPFVLVEDADGEHVLKRFVFDELEDAVAAARDHLRGLEDARRVALAFDGYITVEGERSDAVVVEGQESGDAGAHRLAQRYRPGSALRKLKPIGNAAYLGTGEPLL